MRREKETKKTERRACEFIYWNNDFFDKNQWNSSGKFISCVCFYWSSEVNKCWFFCRLKETKNRTNWIATRKNECYLRFYAAKKNIMSQSWSKKTWQTSSTEVFVANTVTVAAAAAAAVNTVILFTFRIVFIMQFHRQ